MYYSQKQYICYDPVVKDETEQELKPSTALKALQNKLECWFYISSYKKIDFKFSQLTS